MKDLMKLKKAELVEKLNTAYKDINNLSQTIRITNTEIYDLTFKVNTLESKMYSYKRIVTISIPIIIIASFLIGLLF